MRSMAAAHPRTHLGARFKQLVQWLDRQDPILLQHLRGYDVGVSPEGGYAWGRVSPVDDAANSSRFHYIPRSEGRPMTARPRWYHVLPCSRSSPWPSPMAAISAPPP